MPTRGLVSAQQNFEDGTPRGADYAGWMAAELAEFTPLEERWQSITERMGTQMSPNAFFALSRALKAAGLDHARLGVDDARTGAWLGEAGLAKVNCVYNPGLFNEIRLIKTAAEIEIMSQAAHVNEMALLVTAESMQEGSTWDEAGKYVHDVHGSAGWSWCLSDVRRGRVAGNAGAA